MAVSAFGLLSSPSVRTQRHTDNEYQVAYAPVAQLERRLDELARDGFACVALARPEPGSNVPGIVAILARTTPAAASPSAHRVLIGGREDLKTPLTRNGADGFRLCGVVLDEEPPNPRAVVVMARTGAASWQYDVEVLLRYKDSLARLNTIGRDGFVPIAAAPIDDNRIPDQRRWMVISERPSAGGPAREIAVRSDPGPAGLARNLNDSGKQGFRVDLVWKEGNDYVAMLSRPSGEASTPHAYAVDGDAPNGAHALNRLTLADFPYLSRRLFVMDDAVRASNELVEETLPSIDRNAVVEGSGRAMLDTIGDHVSRNRGYQVAYARVDRDRGGKPVLSVMMTRKD
jgi:hypothetical protein